MATYVNATISWSFLVFIVVVSLAVLILLPELFLWAWINLFFTCIPEEALFRGFVQQGLQDRLRDSRIYQRNRAMEVEHIGAFHGQRAALCLFHLSGVAVTGSGMTTVKVDPTRFV